MRPYVILILVIVLLLGLTVANLLYLDYSAGLIAADIAPLYLALEDCNLAAAESYYSSLLVKWKHSEIYWHIVIDHKEIEKIEEQLVLLDSYLANGQIDESKTATSQLRFHLLHIPQMESLCIENVL